MLQEFTQLGPDLDDLGSHHPDNQNHGGASNQPPVLVLNAVEHLCSERRDIGFGGQQNAAILSKCGEREQRQQPECTHVKPPQS